MFTDAIDAAEQLLHSQLLPFYQAINGSFIILLAAAKCHELKAPYQTT